MNGKVETSMEIKVGKQQLGTIANEVNEMTGALKETLGCSVRKGQTLKEGSAFWGDSYTSR